MAAKPFESKIQNLVYNVDVGIGLRLIKGGLYVLVLLTVVLLYTATQFHGLSDAEAMDYAQLGRTLATRGHFSTECIRPITLWCMKEKSRLHNPMINDHPDILHAPLWPALLAGAFKATHVPFTSEQAAGIFPPEQWIVIPLCHLFSLLTGGLVFLLANRLFDRRIALLSMTVYFLSDTVWRTSITGLPLSLVTFLAVAAFYTALIAGNRHAEGRPLASWLIPLLVSLALCVAAFLTRYGALVLAPAIALFIAFSIRPKGWAWAIGFLLVFLIGISPWLARCKYVSGGLLGMAPATAMTDTRGFEGDAFERTLKPNLTVSRIVSEMHVKSLQNFRKFYEQSLRNLGDGLFICLFLTAFFYRFVRTPVHLLRWCVAFAALLLLWIASFFGDVTARLLVMFWPFVIIYGLAFFFILLDRLQLRVRLFSLAVTVGFVLLGALPLIFSMLPPRSGFPYPPYYPPFVMHVSKLLTPDELMCSDMPWATAWYGNRNSLLLPATIDDFYEINDYVKRISGLYFTTLTRDKPYVRGLLTGPEKSWFPLLEGRIPNDFPLAQGFPLNNMDQLFLTDRVRWKN